MKVTRFYVEKIRVEDIQQSHSLDPVDIIVENIQDGVGKITISCYGEVWTGFWGSMGGTVEEFFQHASNDYLINKMSNYTGYTPDLDKDYLVLKNILIKARKEESIDEFEAREAYDWIIQNEPNRKDVFNNGIPYQLECIREELSEPWYLDWPQKKCEKYEYLSRILDLVREVIKPKE